MRQDGRVMKYDWGHQVLTPTTHAMAWAFLYSDCEHEVLPVKSGYRVSLAYDVFTKNEGCIVDSRTEPVVADLSKMIASPTFFPEGITLGFGCAHSYPVRIKWDTKGRELKGLDRVLFNTLTQLKKRYNLKLGWWFAYHSDHLEFMTRSNYYDGLTRSKFKHDFRLSALVADDLGILEGAYLEETNADLELIDHGARVRDDVIWLSQPAVFEEAGAYTAYGNEVSVAMWAWCNVLIAA